MRNWKTGLPALQPFTFAFVFSLFPFNAWNSSQSETHVGHFHSLAEVAAAGGRQSRVKLLWQICFCLSGGEGEGIVRIGGKNRPTHFRPTLRISESEGLQSTHPAKSFSISLPGRFQDFHGNSTKNPVFLPSFPSFASTMKIQYDVYARYCLDAKYCQSDWAFDTWKQHRWVCRFFEKSVSLLLTGLEVL